MRNLTLRFIWKALATLCARCCRWDSAIDTDDTIRCDGTPETLGYYIGDNEARSVLDDLRRIGLDTEHNSFQLDIDSPCLRGTVKNCRKSLHLIQTLAERRLRATGISF